jgi:hypothetical protein
MIDHVGKIATDGYKTRLLDPTDQEALALNNMAVQFMKDLEKNPMKARQDFNAIILPHMMRALKTVKVLDMELEAADLAIKKLLKANVVLIDWCKQKGIDTPNFDEISRTAEAEFEAERRANRSTV